MLPQSHALMRLLFVNRNRLRVQMLLHRLQKFREQASHLLRAAPQLTM
jgi:hypothetical protein